MYDTAKSKIQGKYIAELASDDRWTLDKVQKQVDFLENHGEIGLVFSWCEVLTPDLKEKDRLESVFFALTQMFFKQYLLQFFSHL